MAQRNVRLTQPLLPRRMGFCTAQIFSPCIVPLGRLRITLKSCNSPSNAVFPFDFQNFRIPIFFLLTRLPRCSGVSICCRTALRIVPVPKSPFDKPSSTSSSWSGNVHISLPFGVPLSFFHRLCRTLGYCPCRPPVRLQSLFPSHWTTDPPSSSHFASGSLFNTPGASRNSTFDRADFFPPYLLRF